MRGKSFIALSRLACLAFAIALWGCSRAPRVEPARKTPVEIDVGERLLDPLSPEEIERYQPDIRMGALWAGDHVTATILNRAGKSVEVGPRNFAIIKGRTLRPATSAGNRAEFPVSVLPPGAAASGRFFFPAFGDLTGSYLVFNHPDVRPSRCRIRPQPPQPEARPSESRSEEAPAEKSVKESRKATD